MQLTKLEVKGFKSFGDKITVNFDKGITGIVGPNGCGKSNIVDSIRWVLGEQKTRALRSEKMENIIFNGTKNRKALQMAEVSLTFKNTKNLIPTEYSEVTITRRYYRSGESEYLLNGVTCRLKDVTDLFLDTGIGSDSYAIIELKMVDDILNDKDNSRRTLFEEAAGISKFKVRKKQTLLKLKNTDKDLERVEDVLFEIEKNLKSLEKQAKQAERYHNLKTEYKEYSVSLAKISLKKHRLKIDEINNKIALESDKKNNNASQVAEINAKIEQLKKDLITKEQLVATRQKTLNDHVNKIRQYEGDKKIKNERLRFLNERSSNLTEQLLTDKQSIEQFHKEVKALEEQKETLAKLISEQDYLLEDLKTDQDKQKEKVHEVKQRMQEISLNEQKIRDDFFQLKKSIEVNEIQLENLEQELSKTNQDSSSFSDNIVDLETSQRTLADKLNNKNEEVADLKETEEKTQAKIEKTEKQITGIRDKLALVSRELDSKQNEYNLTKSLVDNLEGFPAAIKFLKKNNEWSKDAPLLSDLLTCPVEYRVAIENYLEPWMNYYVVPTIESAYQAVSLLKKSAKGKANFFVLDQFKNYKSTETKTVNNCKKATDIIEYDAKYEDLIHYILDDVYVLDDPNENIPFDRSEIFISKDGSTTKRKNSVFGGSVGLFEGKKIGRAKNLEKLEKEINSLTEKRNKITNELERVSNDLNKLKSSISKELIEETTRQLTTLNEEYIAVKLKLEQVTSVISSNASKKEDLIKNIAIIKEGIEKSKPKLDLAQVALDNVKERIAEEEEKLETQNELLAEISNKFNQENIKVHQNKNRLESLEREANYKNESLTKTNERISKGNFEQEKTATEIKKIIDTADVSEDELLSLYDEKEAIEKGVNEAEKIYYEGRNEIEELDKGLKGINSVKDSSDSLLLELNNNLNEVKLTMTSIKERMSVEFKVDLNQLSFSNEDEEEEEQYEEHILNEKVISLREKIDRLGPINPMAMEAYTEIKDRYDFIIEQRKDLTDAKKSLMDTISEIDTVAKENFTEAFELINENFKKVFRSLFTEEDTCNLTLTDPDAPLDTKIEIIAKPKGKRPLTINQLSGGEKTLTAVALLFSIYLIKPAPFCIFDEVDAPLDDANIDKFNNIIREFSKESQFILVTHNKRTMSTTDIMYGVTMQESGVSKLVPVDLRSFESDYES